MKIILETERLLVREWEPVGFEYRGMRRFGDDDEDSAPYVATKPGNDEA